MIPAIIRVVILVRTANRNKQPFWYALYNVTVEDYDDYGNQVGTHTTHGNPIKAYANISPARGDVAARQFGDDDQYDRTIVIEDRNTPINEYAVLWIDSVPQLDENGALVVDNKGRFVTPWDYIVKKVGRGLPIFGNVLIAVSKVSVS